MRGRREPEVRGGEERISATQHRTLQIQRYSSTLPICVDSLAQPMASHPRAQLQSLHNAFDSVYFPSHLESVTN